MALREGQTFAGYRIVRLLGSGGMGEVYLAQHPRLPRQDALKVLPADVSADPDYRARFNREADLASKLWHPHIVSVHDRGEYDGQLWIAMDYVDGLDAGRLLASRYPDGMPANEVVRIVTAVANALDYAHKQGLLHRDVKPANIMLTHLDEPEDEQRVLLADFGIARNVDDISGLTATNMTVGTVAYSAPEQLMGEEIDGRADEYALAATAYQLLTGSQLFPHSNRAVVISHHLNKTPPALADLRPDLVALDPVLAVALAKDPDHRFSRCADFAHALAESTTPGAASSAAPTAAAPASHKAAPRAAQIPGRSTAVGVSPKRWLTLAIALVVFVLASAVALAWHPWQHEPSASTPTSSSQSPAATTSSAAPPPPPRLFPASAVDTVLLTPTEINTLVAVGTLDPLLQVRQTTYGMLNNSNLVTPQECAGVIFTGERAVFADTGFVAMRNQTLEPPGGAYSATGLTQVQQSVVAYPTPEQAQTVLTSSQRQWRSCASGRVRLGTVGQNGENNLTFDLGPVQLHGDVLAVPMVANSQESGGGACQQALAVRANVVVAVRACRYPEPPPGQLEAGVSSVRKDAEPLASAMLDKITV
ncbi:serine/threonine-protein kinase PknH/PknJ [Mycobacterium gordonae]|uniref:non-specific serine/threonine protein kinase n=1 Tax=Mycobacterium gordonae TaxID=1778 RepID=A0A1X1XBX3_MYCGO|nr:serine/threonine-protein kinase PknH/PknJ [Mycobacterium gordonae]MCV7007968.1 sensor domain-containing protein [Mycobacterium gordonae]ODR17091.1 hypothetical protein BHQ23_27600 [Mycobacterium gordonae]ORV96431.1 hypothetical protein AWC08_00235 [Mycobacterium gordonae]